ncbi:MAG TPA: hypothetical protein PLD59_13765 [Tepidisphaeraceae bacterium]|nr:hypothetical protein [Tepidisphaeraceae bacterium]
MKREKRKRWVQRGRYAVELDIEVVYPMSAPETACIEPATAKWIDEVARRAAAGDLAYLKSVGRVFEAVAA